MSLVRDERAGLAADLSLLGPQAPTLCEGWLARDLLTHLLLRENDPLAIPGMAVSVFDQVTAARARRLEASDDWKGLIRRFAHGPDRLSVFRMPGMDVTANTMEFFIHHEDLLRAQPDWSPRHLGHRAEMELASVLRRQARLLLRRSPVGVRIELTGQGFDSTFPARPGNRIVTVSGMPSEILLMVTGRTDVARVELHGEPDSVNAFLRSDRTV